MAAVGTLVGPRTDSQSRSDTSETESNAGEILKQVVEQCLRSHGYANSLRGVEVAIRDDCHVILSGTVSSYFLKSIAQEAIKGMMGVDRIENRLLVPSF